MTTGSSRVRRARWGLNAALVLLVVLHVMPPPGDPEWILLGFVPWHLAYALLWIFAAVAVVAYMTGPPWPDEPPPPLQPRPDEPEEVSPS